MDLRLDLFTKRGKLATILGKFPKPLIYINCHHKYLILNTNIYWLIFNQLEANGMTKPISVDFVNLVTELSTEIVGNFTKF
jgi:hypothetical protein